jgi:hypothetical protein
MEAVMRGGKSAGLAALLAAALLGGCSEEKAQAPEAVLLDPRVARALPTPETLPVGHNKECGCVRDGQCTVLEEIPGGFETRNLSCRWERVNAVAQCRYEQRFVAMSSNENGSIRELPGSWGAAGGPVTLLPNGRWCLGT